MTEGSDNMQARVDVKTLMGELRAEVARKRESGEYPAEWFAKGDPDSVDPEQRDDLDANLRRANETALLVRRQDLGGGAAAFLKRTIRRLVLFHTDFLADQIDRHNAAVVRVLNRYKRMMEESAIRAARDEDVLAKYGQRIADLENGRTKDRIDAVEKVLRDKGMLS